MSELDADLYGDLYGDDSEFVVPTEERKESAEPEVKPPSSTPAKAATPAPEEPKPIQTVTSSTSTTYAPESSKAANGGATNYSAQSQAYSNQFSNYQIQNQGQSEAYGNQNQYSNDYGGTQPIASSLTVIDRTVRPSEMKEEG
ncbi:hypothetical protein BD410DRAFT_501478 [Rickenella mellea]|uniref:Uncharacterized protein n=1 Tax=Rickenella mellea TaxID=50990 RepID=A0A4Y7PTN9_9AGAM|nr:hypothetical protein BD410DRAFT_501478 [Rickenella mellea]